MIYPVFPPRSVVDSLEKPECFEELATEGKLWLGWFFRMGWVDLTLSAGIVARSSRFIRTFVMLRDYRLHYQVSHSIRILFLDELRKNRLVYSVLGPVPDITVQERQQRSGTWRREHLSDRMYVSRLLQSPLSPGWDWFRNVVLHFNRKQLRLPVWTLGQMVGFRVALQTAGSAEEFRDIWLNHWDLDCIEHPLIRVPEHDTLLQLARCYWFAHYKLAAEERERWILHELNTRKVPAAKLPGRKRHESRRSVQKLRAEAAREAARIPDILRAEWGADGED